MQLQATRAQSPRVMQVTCGFGAARGGQRGHREGRRRARRRGRLRAEGSPRRPAPCGVSSRCPPALRGFEVRAPLRSRAASPAALESSPAVQWVSLRHPSRLRGPLPRSAWSLRSPLARCPPIPARPTSPLTSPPPALQVSPAPRGSRAAGLRGRARSVRGDVSALAAAAATAAAGLFVLPSRSRGAGAVAAAAAAGSARGRAGPGRAAERGCGGRVPAPRGQP